jgi:hypothetical protein
MPDSAAVYLHVKIQLVRGKHRIFMTAMGEMLPALESYGWRLIGGFTPVIGRLGAVYHVWRVPSADGVLSALDRVRAHPSARRWHDAFAESIEDEALELVRPTSYSPAP